MADLRSTLFVGNLSVFCTEQDIQQVFEPYGQITEIRMAKSEDNNKHLSYGFVKFANVASAQLAMHDLNGLILCGRPLKIGKALSRSNKKEEETESMRQSYSTASVHVTFISHQVERVVTEESLRFLFGRFGQVVDAIICKSNVDQRQNRQSGYGFIHFAGGLAGVEASFAAAQTLCDVMIDEVNYKCKISRDLEVQLQGATPVLDQLASLSTRHANTSQSLACRLSPPSSTAPDSQTDMTAIEAQRRLTASQFMRLTQPGSCEFEQSSGTIAQPQTMSQTHRATGSGIKYSRSMTNTPYYNAQSLHYSFTSSPTNYPYSGNQIQINSGTVFSALSSHHYDYNGSSKSQSPRALADEDFSNNSYPYAHLAGNNSQMQGHGHVDSHHHQHSSHSQLIGQTSQQQQQTQLSTARSLLSDFSLSDSPSYENYKHHTNTRRTNVPSQINQMAQSKQQHQFYAESQFTGRFAGNTSETDEELPQNRLRHAHSSEVDFAPYPSHYNHNHHNSGTYSNSNSNSHNNSQTNLSTGNSSNNSSSFSLTGSFSGSGSGKLHNTDTNSNNSQNNHLNTTNIHSSNVNGMSASSNNVLQRSGSSSTTGSLSTDLFESSSTMLGLGLHLGSLETLSSSSFSHHHNYNTGNNSASNNHNNHNHHSVSLPVTSLPTPIYRPAKKPQPNPQSAYLYNKNMGNVNSGNTSSNTNDKEFSAKDLLLMSDHDHQHHLHAHRNTLDSGRHTSINCSHSNDQINNTISNNNSSNNNSSNSILPVSQQNSSSNHNLLGNHGLHSLLFDAASSTL